MLKLSLSARKLLLTSQMVVFSCGYKALPNKPEGQLCTIDLPRNQLLCYPINPAKRSLQVSRMRESELNVIPLNNADRYIAFSPDTWSNVSFYMKELKRVAKKKCRSK